MTVSCHFAMFSHGCVRFRSNELSPLIVATVETFEGVLFAF